MLYRYLKNFFIFIVVVWFFDGCASSPVIGNYQVTKDSPNMHRATLNPYTVMGVRYTPKIPSIGQSFRGIASWYGDDFHGKYTSNGEVYNMHRLTAAHKTFPMNTLVKVSNLDNGRSVVVRINDRGPFVKGRIIDLSYKAAHAINMQDAGTANVRVEVLQLSSNISPSYQKHTPKKKQYAKGTIFVQIASFSSFDRALKYKKRFHMKYGKPALISKKVVNDRVVYKVLIGSFDNRELASNFIEQNSEFYKAFIVRSL